MSYGIVAFDGPQPIVGEIDASSPDVTATGSLGALNADVRMDVGEGQATWYFELSGTFTAGTTVVWEKTLDGTTWSGLNAWTATSGGLLLTSIAGSGVTFRGRTNCAAFKSVRVRCSLYNGSDNVTVQMRAGFGNSGAYLVAPLPAGANAIGTVTTVQADPTRLNATVVQGAAASLAGAWPVIHTDGTNTMPSGDVPGRSIQTSMTDGANVLGTPGHPVRTDPTGTTPQPVTGSVTAAQGAAAALGAAWPFEMTDGNNVLGTPAHPVRTDPTGTTPQPITASALPLPAGAAEDATLTGGAQKTQVVDATGHVQPSGDVASRGIQVIPGDGTRSATLKAASTAAAATDTALVVGLSPNSPLPAGSNALGTVGVTGTVAATAAQGAAAALVGAWPMLPTDGTHTMPMGDAAARALFMQLTDGTSTLGTLAHPVQTSVTNGTQSLPTGDAPARKIFTAFTDGTNTAAVKAASTAALSTDPSAVVGLSPNSPLPAGTNALGSVTVTGTPAVSANQGTAAVLAGAWPTKITDGTNTMPTGDTRARALQVTPGDGTNAQTFKAASTPSAATDIPGVVALHPSSPLPVGTNSIGAVQVNDGAGHTLPAADTAARKLFAAMTDGTNTAAVKAASTAPAATDPAIVIAISPNGPATVVGAAAAGTAISGNPVLAGGSDGANARALLTDTSGRLENVGAAAAGAAAAGNPVQVGGVDPGGKVQALSQNNDKSLAVCLTSDAQVIQSNASLTTSGSATFTGLGHKEVNLFVNVKTAPTGTLPTLTYTVQELDPGDQATAIGTSVTGLALIAVGTQTLKLPDTTTGCIKVSWAIGGTASPTFPSVYATLTVKPTEDTIEQFAPVAEDNVNGVVAVTLKPMAVATYAWTAAFTTALATNLIAKNTFGVLRKLFVRVDSTATTGTYYVQVFNSATLPADTTGTGTMLVAPKRVALVNGTEQYLELDYTDAGIGFSAGLVVVLSTTEFTKTIVLSNWLSVTALLK